jgi:hypothetical protein
MFIKPIITELEDDYFHGYWEPDENDGTHIYHLPCGGIIKFVVFNASSKLDISSHGYQILVDLIGEDDNVFRVTGENTTRLRKAGHKYYLIISKDDPLKIRSESSYFIKWMKDKEQTQKKLLENLESSSIPNLLTEDCLEKYVDENDRVIKEKIDKWMPWSKLMNLLENENELQKVIEYCRKDSFVSID